MPHLEINSINVDIEGHEILKNISLNVETGEIVCLLGLSGEGKTTLLRTIAGFLQPKVGELTILNQLVANSSMNMPVEQRQLGMVFQDFALFPHLSVKKNILFGIQAQSHSEQQQKLQELTELLNMSSFVDLYPHQLSGGQQQRVAIARALAPGPKLLLMDEPFSNLDTELRERLACELREVLKATNVTTIMICHNQHEAFAIADRIGVLNKGCLEQVDTAFNLYHQPKTMFIADFIGEGMLIDGIVKDSHSIETELGIINDQKAHAYAESAQVKVLIRPDDIIHDDSSNLQALVRDKVFRGAEFLYTLELNNGEQVLSLVPSHHDHAIDQPIGIRLEIDHMVAFDDK